MGYTRSAVIALVSTLSLILPVAAQGKECYIIGESQYNIRSMDTWENPEKYTWNSLQRSHIDNYEKFIVGIILFNVHDSNKLWLYR